MPHLSVMEKFLSLKGEYVSTKIIEKSRFITTSRHISDEREARAFIDGIRAKYIDATHNCYAYICDRTGNFLRFSDDGEPQGTAGMPMLEVLKTRRIFEAAVVVTRYFGGIKLGAGGLVRAYSGCVAENLDGAQKAVYAPCVESEYTVDYPSADVALRYFSDNGCRVISSDYQAAVTFLSAVEKEREVAFNAGLINALNGKVKIVRKREYFFPFDI